MFHFHEKLLRAHFCGASYGTIKLKQLFPHSHANVTLVEAESGEQ
jgi:hypothetical protein